MKGNDTRRDRFICKPSEKENVMRAVIASITAIVLVAGAFIGWHLLHKAPKAPAVPVETRAASKVPSSPAPVAAKAEEPSYCYRVTVRHDNEYSLSQVAYEGFGYGLAYPDLATKARLAVNGVTSPRPGITDPNLWLYAGTVVEIPCTIAFRSRTLKFNPRRFERLQRVWIADHPIASDGTALAKRTEPTAAPKAERHATNRTAAGAEAEPEGTTTTAAIEITPPTPDPASKEAFYGSATVFSGETYVQPVMRQIEQLPYAELRKLGFPGDVNSTDLAHWASVKADEFLRDAKLKPNQTAVAADRAIVLENGGKGGLELVEYKRQPDGTVEWVRGRNIPHLKLAN
ncbi:MAG TPA: hypothetical protein VMT99_00190 [Candidatus Paceibacterota bacterium]|nr:hypothetical protein [Candidatus Paceibacterota bacterium]